MNNADRFRAKVAQMSVQMIPAPDGKEVFEPRPVRLLVEKTHTNRNCSPRSATYSPGDQIEVIWLNGWVLTDGMRKLASGVEGVDFEFVKVTV